MPQRDEFFRNLGVLAVTFDDVGINIKEYDVTVRTGYTEILPYQVSLETKFTRNVGLKIPIVSAAMDTITEHEMAIRMAELGGIGIIHRNLSVEAQAREVTRVKYHHCGFVEKPISVRLDDTIEEVLNRREEKGYPFHSFIVVNNDGKLVGLITHRSFKFCRNVTQRVSEIMTTDVTTGSSRTTPDEAFEIMQRSEVGVLPLIDGEGNPAGLYVHSGLKSIISGNTTFNLDSKGRLRVAAAIGVGEKELMRAERLIRKNVDVLVINTAHADSRLVYDTLRELKRMYPETDVAVGNISEAESAKRLCEAGADGILVGQGPGSICTTRIVAGYGCPQLTATHDVSSAARPYGVPVCADGGLRCKGHISGEECFGERDPELEMIQHSGDITKALGGGAHCVVLGKILSGTKETPGEIFFLKGKQWKVYRGMGSLDALLESDGSRGRYGQRDVKPEELVPEGIKAREEYKGPVGPVVYQCCGGLRSGMASVGSRTVEEHQEKCDFRLVTPAGMRESHPHDVEVTEDTPNFARDDNKNIF